MDVPHRMLPPVTVPQRMLLPLTLVPHTTFASLSVHPAKAEILYPYCTTETRWEGPHCDFRTFEQCVAAVAGRATTCVPNKWYIAAQTQAKRPAG